MKHNQLLRFIAWIIMASIAAGWIWLVMWGNHKAIRNGDSSQPVSYKIIYDEMGFVIRIGVPEKIDEEQLKATLIKAANEHQNDAARDYLMMEHLLVEAYLDGGVRLSSIPAGRIRRYIPPRNSEFGSENKSEQDSFIINLDEAKRDLR